MPSAALQEAPGFMPWSERLDACDARDAPAGKAATAWLQEPGLLAERLRACCGGRPGLVVVAEALA